MKIFKVRASASAKLLTYKGKISVGATPKSYAKEWLISKITNKTKKNDSKYLRRGIEVEDLAIKRVSEFLKKDFKKNEKYYEDDFFTGTPDVIHNKEFIIDVKSSWDCFTFPYFMSEPPLIYVAQLQVYMHLLGIEKAKLCYCLENGTEEQINQLAWSKTRECGLDEVTIDIWDEAEKELNYDHLDDKLRIKIFEITYDESIINELKKSVIFLRDFIDTELMIKLKIVMHLNN